MGGVPVGGGAPVSVQTMSNVDPHDAAALAAQISRCAEAGCDIFRAAVPDEEAAETLGEVRRKSPIPIVADIHFDYRCALAAIAHGADAVRINPGNIGARDRVSAVARAAKERGVPVRIGVNGGSLEKGETLVSSALKQLKLLEDEGLRDIAISAKASNAAETVETYRELAEKTDCPLHLGVTEAGTLIPGTVRSSVAMGILLSEGIGDTIRVSLTGDPVEEIKSGKQILRTLGLRTGGIDVVSCPTCGRTKIDLIGLANQVETMVQGYPLNIKVAVMGCAVNGPGEAREADLGIAGGVGEGLLMKHGKIIRKVPEGELLDALRQELDSML